MSNLRTLLRDADPLLHEAPRLDAERDRVRLAILGTTPVEPSTGFKRARLTLLGAFTVVVAMVAAAFAYQVWLHGTTTVLAAVRFEVRLAEDRPMPGLVVAQVADTGRLIYLHPEIVVNNDDIAQSWVLEETQGRFGVAVQFLPPGAERVRQATTAHVGRPVAIMVDGRVVLAPVVRSAISDSAVISGDYTQADANRIADGIARR